VTPSIARRLTLSVGVIAVIVFTVVGTLLYLALERELLRRETEELTGRLNFVRHLLTEVPNLSSVAELTHHVDDMVASHGHLHAWIKTADGGIVYGGKPPAAPNTDSSRPFYLVMSDGTPTRAVIERLVPSASLPGLQILLAMDVRPTQRVLTSFGLALALVCLGGVAAMLLLGAWVARRGLAPVNTLSSQAHAIGPQALSQRLPERDIPAELLVLAQSFNRVLDRLEQSYRQLEAFNADVAHELRTPLTNLIGTTEVALSRGRGTDELRDVLASNLEELARVKTIVNDMLFLARADRGERAHGEGVALESVARDVAEFFEALLEERRITLTIDGAANVIGDRGLLRRALTNLVSNALRYTSAGHSIQIVIASEGQSVSLRARNPGPPIPGECLPHIFNRFYRVDPARSKREEGHGLGLAIVKAVVQMHGGRVFARSLDGVTEIGFSIPAAS
jgi:two-component system heavy metal sensor histidine kinase CusS